MSVHKIFWLGEMRLKRFFNFKLFSRGAKKVVTTTAEVVSKNPEAASLTETVIKRVTNYAHVGERLIHFHLVVFGIMLGFTMMTSIIALGKLAIALEVKFFAEHRDLILNFGYFSFFAGILYGFVRHYMSKHHKRFIASEKRKLEKEFEAKKRKLEADFNELKVELEKKIELEHARLETLVDRSKNQDESSSVWNTISAYNPVSGRRKKETKKE